MNICIIGNGLISLTLAKALLNKKIKIFNYYEEGKNFNNLNRTIGITENNLDFFQKKILKIKKKLIWKINEIEIYSDQFKNGKILNFNERNKNIFSIIKNNDLFNSINQSLKKNINFKKIKIKNKNFYQKIYNKNNYDLVINCEENNEITKKFFYKKILKNYRSTAYATIIDHEKLENNKAIQIFTKYGPLAFLPISKFKTSVVYSIKDTISNKSNLDDDYLKKLILDKNQLYKIKTINPFENFKLNSKVLRKYYNKNILAFGDILHKIHPLSGQGFNMTLRDIKILLNLIDTKINLGLPIDYSINKDFENKTKHLNFMFAINNDLIYEIFNFDNFYLKLLSKKTFNFLNSNNLVKNFFINYANKGLYF